MSTDETEINQKELPSNMKNIKIIFFILKEILILIKYLNNEWNENDKKKI